MPPLMASVPLTHQEQVHWGYICPTPLKTAENLSAYLRVESSPYSYFLGENFPFQGWLSPEVNRSIYPLSSPYTTVIFGFRFNSAAEIFCWFHHWCKGKLCLQQCLISILEHRSLCMPEPSSFLRYFQSTLEIPLILPCSEIKSMMSFPDYLKSILAKRVRVSLPQHM